MTDSPPDRGGGPGGYLRRHWQGRQSLAWSFWVNLVLLRAIILALDRFTRPPFLEDPALVVAATLIFFVTCHLLVFAWQVVGVVRACDAYQASFGASGVILITYLGIAATVVLTLISAVGAILQLFQEPEGELSYLIWERERAARYSLVLDEETERLHFSGSFELGVTKKLTALLEEQPGIRGIVLDSPGGHIYEGRGVAKLVQRHGLDTYVFGSCSSACTTAFIAGRTRSLGPEGRLGFHRHWMAADYPVFLVDAEAEMAEDLAFYEAQGIAPAFLAQVFDAPHDGLWFPAREELLAAGVVHRSGSPPE